MKWLFSILLIANLGMFIWLFPQHDGRETEAAPYQNVGELLLVGEVERDQTAEDLRAADEAPESAPQEITEEPPSVLSQHPVESPQMPPVEDSPRPPSDSASTVTPPVVPSVQCGNVGYFDKRSQAELLSVKLLAQGVKSDIASELSNEQAGYWVLIPPQKDREGAVEVAKKLEAAGVADIWRFTSGNLAHAISLGLFRDEERAIARRDQIAGLGFEPEVRPRYREQSRYWLNYRYTGDSSLSDEFWNEVESEFPDLQRDEKPCP